jgi:hypothetical protein
MIASALKGKMLVFGVFFLGMVTGALLINVYETRLRADSPVEGASRQTRELEGFFDYLNLTSEQRAQWTTILAEAQPEYDKIFEANRMLTAPNRLKFDALREQTRERIRGILSEEQLQKYNDFNERRRQQRQSAEQTRSKP